MPTLDEVGVGDVLFDCCEDVAGSVVEIDADDVIVSERNADASFDKFVRPFKKLLLGCWRLAELRPAPESGLDLSRFRAAPSARLGHFPFEKRRGFSSSVLSGGDVDCRSR